MWINNSKRDSSNKCSIKKVDPIAFDVIDEELVLGIASITKGGSGLDADLDAGGRRRMLNSNSFGTASWDLRKSIADFMKKLCSKRINSENQSLEAFIECQLISLNKNPGLKTIGVGKYFVEKKER